LEAVHVDFDGSNLAVSLFIISDMILVRPKTDAVMENLRFFLVARLLQ